MPTELTRSKLFEEVWKRPMTKVAADYGISDVALKKICTKHDIPVPQRGHWAKKAAGKKVMHATLPPAADPSIERIFIQGSPSAKLPNSVKKAAEAAKKRERQPENKVTVVSAPKYIHDKVAKTAKKLDKATASEKGLLEISGADVFDVAVAPESSMRVVKFLSSLITAAEARGYQTSRGEKALRFVVEGEDIEFKLVEQTRRLKHQPTETELAAIEKWERRQQKRRHSWDYDTWTTRPTPPEWDYVPNGCIKIALNEGVYGYNGLRRTFSDGKTQRIETLINGILEAFAIWAAAIKEKRIQDERREREWAEAERRRKEKQKLNALEKKRVEALLVDLERWRQRKLVLAYIDYVRENLDALPAENMDAINEWIEWAEAYADQLNPLRKSFPKLLQFDDFRSWELY